MDTKTKLEEMCLLELEMSANQTHRSHINAIVSLFDFVRNNLLTLKPHLDCFDTCLDNLLPAVA